MDGSEVSSYPPKEGPSFLKNRLKRNPDLYSVLSPPPIVSSVESIYVDGAEILRVKTRVGSRERRDGWSWARGCPVSGSEESVTVDQEEGSLLPSTVGKLHREFRSTGQEEVADSEAHVSLQTLTTPVTLCPSLPFSYPLSSVSFVFVTLCRRTSVSLCVSVFVCRLG